MNSEVTQFLATLEHPLIAEIETLRAIILSANKDLTEIVKWNAPSFCHEGRDCLTMRIHPPKQIQLIFHRGAKVQILPEKRLINDSSGLLQWKTNDRAIATFKNQQDMEAKTSDLQRTIQLWIEAMNA